MNRIVRDHYPVADLPKDLREAFVDDAFVRIVVETVGPRAVGKTKPFSLADMYARFPKSFETLEEVADHIRDLREEWD